MPDRPPQHSAALAELLATTTTQPELQPSQPPAPTSRTWANREEHAAYLAGLRRTAAARSRARQHRTTTLTRLESTR